MSPRRDIGMSAEEAAAFVAAQPTAACATLGRDGWPHVMPLWFVVRGDDLWAWTYRKSQKVRNLERDPRCTLQIEAGVAYDDLRGVMLRCEATLHRDAEAVEALGNEIMRRYARLEAAGGTPDAEPAPPVAEMVRRQAPKRVAMQFRERSRATWDHRKL